MLCSAVVDQIFELFAELLPDLQVGNRNEAESEQIFTLGRVEQFREEVFVLEADF